jgi:hypothetical protein
MRSLREDSALTRCNFDPGQPDSPEALVDEDNGWSLEDCKRGWDMHELREFETEWPLRLWHVLCWQCVIPSP